MKKAVSLLLCIVLFIGTLTIPISAESPAQSGLSDAEWLVLLLTNRERLQSGVQPLTSLPRLQTACDTRAEEIVRSFSHTRPDGAEWVTVLDDVGLPSMIKAGENICAGYSTAADAVDGWMNSAGHRANILNSAFVHMGVGYHFQKNSLYGTHWVQLFYTGASCAYTSMRLVGSTVARSCKTIDEAHLTLELNCSCGSKAYLPVMKEFCTGFTPGKPGVQTIRITCLGMKEDFSVYVPQMDDVPESAWYAPAVRYVLEKGLFAGTSGTQFSPNAPMTRAMLVTVLYRHAGSPAAGDSPFSDVPENRWYSAAVSWAYQEDVVRGVGDGSQFQPEGILSREQLATILYRYNLRSSQPLAASDSLTDFPDADTIGSYALQGMQWAVGAGLLNGALVNGTAYLQPKAQASRAQVAAILMRYCENIAK